MGTVVCHGIPSLPDQVEHMAQKWLAGQDRQVTVLLCVHVLTLPVQRYYISA